MAPPKHGFQKPKNVGATFARLLGYLGKSKFLLILVSVSYTHLTLPTT